MRGEAHERSDYDIGFLATDSLPGVRMARLRDDLEELPIPGHVELVDFRTVPEGFSRLVLAHREDLEVWKKRRTNSLFT